MYIIIYDIQDISWSVLGSIWFEIIETRFCDQTMNLRYSHAESKEVS